MIKAVEVRIRALVYDEDNVRILWQSKSGERLRFRSDVWRAYRRLGVRLFDLADEGKRSLVIA